MKVAGTHVHLVDEATPDGEDASSLRILIIEARYYDDIADALVEGACAELKRHGVQYTVVTVPGALEIPLALSRAAAEGLVPSNDPDGFDGAVVLGCVIRGETAHFDVVTNNANHFVTDLAVRHNIPLGNAILTVENKDQAMARATGGEQSKGAQAVRACLTLLALYEQHAMSDPQ